MGILAHRKESMDSNLIDKGVASSIGAVVTLVVTWIFSLFRRGRNAEIKDLNREEIQELRDRVKEQEGEVSEIRVGIGRMEERIEAGKGALHEFKRDLVRMSTHIDDRFDKFEDRLLKIIGGKQ